MKTTAHMTGYFVTYCGVPQFGVWGPDEDVLQELLDDRFEGINIAIKEDPNNWKIEKAQIVFTKEASDE